MKRRIALIEFPGSHGLEQVEDVYQSNTAVELYRIWHDDVDLREPDLLIIPGGYAFGDYLRPGALARSSNIAGPIRKFAEDGGQVLGIGNGFQILCELEVLPGVLMRNPQNRFFNKLTYLTVENPKGEFFQKYSQFELLRLPVANYFGRYWADRRTIRELEDEGQILLRYCDANGDVDLDTYFNGSLGAIAGICNRKGNVTGVMPHPERAMKIFQGSEDGMKFFMKMESRD